MKKGKSSILELAKELEFLAEQKHDFIAPTNAIRMQDDGSLSVAGAQPPPLQVVEGKMAAANDDFAALMDRPSRAGQYDVGPVAHDQISEHLKIPRAYYKRMREESPALLAENVNHWFAAAKPEARRMVRTIGTRARAFLSNKYRIIDNEDALSAILPTLKELHAENNLKVESCDVTERNLYIKCVFPKIKGDVKVGDVVQAGFVLRNSEIGLGSIWADPLFYRLWCANGAVMADHGIKKYHIGRALDDGVIYADDTMKKIDEAFVLKLRDTIRGFATQDGFNALLESLRETTTRQIEADIPKTVEVVRRRFNLTEGVGSGILTELVNGGDASQYGLGNAVTAFSQKVESYDLATDLEKIGGDVFQLDGAAWKQINELAKAA